MAGYPDAATSLAHRARARSTRGADLLEIGLPYSDPLADGATLQRASAVALRNGARLDDSIELVGRIRAARPDVPLGGHGLRQPGPRWRSGATVLRRLGEAGVSGFILADLTPDEGADWRLRPRTWASPSSTSWRRRRPSSAVPLVAAQRQGFLYAVSLAGVTGARTRLRPESAAS